MLFIGIAAIIILTFETYDLIVNLARKLKKEMLTILDYLNLVNAIEIIAMNMIIVFISLSFYRNRKVRKRYQEYLKRNNEEEEFVL
jgi:hypothetical protein